MMTEVKREYEKPALKKSTILLQSVVAQFVSAGTTDEGGDDEEEEEPQPSP